MDHFKLKSASILLCFVFILLSPAILIHTTYADHVSGQSEQDKRQSFFEIVQDSISLVAITRFGSWDKVKSVLRQMQSSVFPPNLDFRGADESQTRGSGGGEGVGGKMKKAAEKSFGTSQVVIEETAKSAAKVVGEAVQQTTEKVKETIHVDENEASEL